MGAKRIKLKKSEIIGVYAAMVASFALYYKGVFLKSREKVADLNHRIAAQKVDVDKAQAAYMDVLNRKVASVDDTGDAYDKYAQSNTSFANVIGTLAKGDGKSPFALNKIVTEKQETENGYTKTLFSIDVDASFPAIGGFLEGLELSPLLTDIQTVEISRISSELKRCSAKIKLLSYVVRK